jgi:hypothetical protein
MDRLERVALIERLRDENARSRAEIERRQAEREANPFADIVPDQRDTGDPDDLHHGEPIAEALMRKSDDGLGLAYRTIEDATPPAPQPEPEVFNADQIDELAHLVNAVRAEVRREFEQDLERVEQRILQTVLRLIMPAEVAERQVHALNDRVARLEGRIERQLSPATADVVDLPNWRKRSDAA